MCSHGPPTEAPGGESKFDAQVSEKEGMTVMEIRTYRILEELSVVLSS